MLVLLSTARSGWANLTRTGWIALAAFWAEMFYTARDFLAPRLLWMLGVSVLALMLLLAFGPAEAQAQADTGTYPVQSGPITYGYSEMCEASYYGGPLIGNYTASGEIFTGEAGTAAHPWLPFGTIVRVDSPYGTTLLRITDRGPYIPGRCIDVSEGSNWIVGGYLTGVAPVTVSVVSYP